MRIGYGRSDITPPLGVELAGYGYDLNRRASGVLDPLYARCIAVEQEGVLSFLIAADLLAFGATVSTSVEAELYRHFQAPRERIALIATHTHTGPSTTDLGGCGEPDPAYLAALPGRILAAAREAAADLQEAAGMRLSEGRIEPVGYNRALEGGPEDHGVRGFALLRASAPAIAVLGYNCHPVTLGRDARISADYPGRAVAALERRGYRALYLTGVCGDIDPVINRESWGSGTESTIESYGRRIAEGFLSGLQEAIPLRDCACARLDLPLALARYTPKDVQEIAEAAILRSEDEGQRRVIRNWAETVVLQPEEHAAAHFLRIGPAAIVGISYEPFTALAGLLREAFPECPLMVSGNAGATLGYLPTSDKLALGGYETLDSAFVYGRLPAAMGAPEALMADLAEALQPYLSGGRQ